MIHYPTAAVLNSSSSGARQNFLQVNGDEALGLSWAFSKKATPRHSNVYALTIPYKIVPRKLVAFFRILRHKKKMKGSLFSVRLPPETNPGVDGMDEVHRYPWFDGEVISQSDDYKGIGALPGTNIKLSWRYTLPPSYHENPEKTYPLLFLLGMDTDKGKVGEKNASTGEVNFVMGERLKTWMEREDFMEEVVIVSLHMIDFEDLAKNPSKIMNSDQAIASGQQLACNPRARKGRFYSVYTCGCLDCLDRRRYNLPCSKSFLKQQIAKCIAGHSYIARHVGDPISFGKNSLAPVLLLDVPAQGLQVLSFIREVLTPHFRQKLAGRLQTDNGVGIIGSDVGGLQACYAGLKHGDFFTRVGCLSPRILWPLNIDYVTLDVSYGQELLKLLEGPEFTAQPASTIGLRRKWYVDRGTEDDYMAVLLGIDLGERFRVMEEVLREKFGFASSSDLVFSTLPGEQQLQTRANHRLWRPMLHLYGAERAVFHSDVEEPVTSDPDYNDYGDYIDPFSSASAKATSRTKSKRELNFYALAGAACLGALLAGAISALVACKVVRRRVIEQVRKAENPYGSYLYHKPMKPVKEVYQTAGHKNTKPSPSTAAIYGDTAAELLLANRRAGRPASPGYERVSYSELAKYRAAGEPNVAESLEKPSPGEGDEDGRRVNRVASPPSNRSVDLHERDGVDACGKQLPASDQVSSKSSGDDCQAERSHPSGEEPSDCGCAPGEVKPHTAAPYSKVKKLSDQKAREKPDRTKSVKKTNLCHQNKGGEHSDQQQDTVHR